MGSSSTFLMCHGNYPAPVWYVNDDELPNFNDYKQIYDWKSPAMKLFELNTNVCDINSNLNYRAQSYNKYE